MWGGVVILHLDHNKRETSDWIYQSVLMKMFAKEGWHQSTLSLQSRLLYNWVYRSVTISNLIYQGVLLSCTSSACFWYREKMAYRTDISTAFKRCVKKAVTDLSNAINSNWFFNVSLPFMWQFERCDWTSKQGVILNTWFAPARHSSECESRCHQFISSRNDVFICYICWNKCIMCNMDTKIFVQTILWRRQWL